MSVVDRVLFNGQIRTQDARRPLVSALALVGERIVAGGSDDDMLALAGPDIVRDDLAGRHVIPGLIDAHIHWAMTARSLQEVDVFELPSRELALQRVAARVARTAPGEWISGNGWSQDFWPERRFSRCRWDLPACRAVSPT